MATGDSHLNVDNNANPRGFKDTPSSDIMVTPDGGLLQRLGAALAAIAGGGVTSIIAGSGISRDVPTGAVTITNTGYIPGGTDVAVTDGGTGASTAAAARTNLGVSVDAIEYVIDGGGSTISTGVKGDLQIPYACTITAATLLADQSGSIVVNVWKDTYANYPPVVGDKITASAPPTITTATKSTDSTLTGWTTSIAAGDTLRFNVDSVTTITRVTLILTIAK